MAIITHGINIETCNQNQTPLSLGQSSTLTSCWPFWILAIMRNHKNSIYNSWSQHRDLKSKMNLTMFGSIFNFNMISAILDFGHYQKSQKWHLCEITKTAFITHRVNIKTCNQNQTPLSLGQSSTLTSCQQFWILAIMRNHKDSIYNW